jgi:inosine-uridine nucleoside N-ribohydrolase
MALEPIRAILDVDTGVDDAMAIALAVAAPTIDLVAVTTVAGNVELEHTTRNTLRVLDFIGAQHIPVYRGMSRPMDRPLHNAAHIHGTDGLGGADIPESTRTVEALSAPQFLIDAARQSPEQLTFIFVGPLTNLAVAVALEPDLPRLVKRLVIMGGAFRIPGNTTATAEFNIFADPEAAAQVLATGFNATWVGLDVTTQAVFARAQWDALADATTPNAQIVRKAGAQMFVTFNRPVFQLHDPLAVAVAADPTLVDAPEEVVMIETGGRYSAGQTIIQRSGREGGFRTGVAKSVDTERFGAFFAGTLGLPKQ